MKKQNASDNSLIRKAWELSSKFNLPLHGDSFDLGSIEGAARKKKSLNEHELKTAVVYRTLTESRAL